MDKSHVKSETPKSFKELKLQGITCPFEKFNNTEETAEMFGEDAIFCQETIYQYEATDTNVLYQHPFEVRGIQSQPITYWFSIFLGFDMIATSPGIKVYVMRESSHDPSICLLDKSCVSGEMVSPGRLKLDGILTSGRYKLVIYNS